MDRLISANKLEEALHKLMKRRGVKSWLSTAFDATDFETLIDEAETVEAEPVKHGTWEDAHDWDEWYARVYKCSNCGGTTLGCKDAFCNCCGAKMSVGKVYEEDEEDV